VRRKQGQLCEPELLLLEVELQRGVLHLEPSDDYRRHRAVPRLDPFHVAKGEARRLAVHVHHGVAADERPLFAALEHDPYVRHGVPDPSGGQHGGRVAQIERRDRRHSGVLPFHGLLPNTSPRTAGRYTSERSTL
jgi:hypothetical protein